MVESREREQQLEEHQRQSFWQGFPLLNTIRRFRDDIRLRRYNREWLKNNPH